jgi:hypothetical protein
MRPLAGCGIGRLHGYPLARRPDDRPPNADSSAFPVENNETGKRRRPEPEMNTFSHVIETPSTDRTSCDHT